MSDDDDERVGLLIDAGDATTSTSLDGVEEDLEVGGDTADVDGGDIERRRRRRASRLGC